jgi:hypothetical protein
LLFDLFSCFLNPLGALGARLREDKMLKAIGLVLILAMLATTSITPVEAGRCHPIHHCKQ